MIFTLAIKVYLRAVLYSRVRAPTKEVSTVDKKINERKASPRVEVNESNPAIEH